MTSARLSSEFTRGSLLATACLVVFLADVQAGRAGDWPQYLRDSARTADAQEEQLPSSLSVSGIVQLDDAILTSPAIVDDRVYIVDQMGAAYCVDPQDSSVVWKTVPSGVDRVGGNTSSPCVFGDRLAYGTTSGFIVLLATTSGDVIRTIDIEQPVLGSIAHANERLYFQSLDGVLYCLDESGRECWRLDHYGDATTEPGSRAKRQFSRGSVAVVDDFIMSAVGFDLVGVRDRGDAGEQIWIQRTPLKDTYLPVGVSLSDGWVYASFPGKDGKGAVLRAKLADGNIDPQRDVIKNQWAALRPPAVRKGKAYFTRQAFGLSTAVFGDRPGIEWSTFSESAGLRTPSIASPVLAGDACLFTLLEGGLAVVRNLNQQVGGDPVAVQSIRTPTQAVVTCSPAVSNGAVCFGADDGCLYVLRGDSADHGIVPVSSTFRREREFAPAGGQRSDWPSAFGGASNACFVDDPVVRPPFKLRWSVVCDGLFKQAVCATENDVVYVTLGGLVACREQMTGRIRWRRHLPGQAWCRSSLLIAEGRVYVPRMFSIRYPKSPDTPSHLYCLSLDDGAIEWSSEIGIGDRLRASPVHAQGVVTFGSLYRPEDFVGETAGVTTAGQAVDAWDAETGEHRWRVRIESEGKFLSGPAGCASEDAFYYSGGGEGIRGDGETVAIVPESGRVLWRSSQFASQTGTPSFRDGRLYLPGTYRRPIACLNAETGKTIWTNDRSVDRWHVDVIALGPDYFSVNNKYRGGAWKWDLLSGEPLERDGDPLQLWGPAHGCGAIVLTASGYALSATIGGLCMTDVNTGELAWNTPGFASYTCPHPVAASSRIFYAPQTSGMLFCFEPTAVAEETEERR